MFDSGHFITVELRAKAGHEPAKVLAALQSLCEASAREPGCILFTVHQGAADPAQFVLWEGFRSADALAAHAAEPHSQQFTALGLVEPVRVIKSVRGA